MKQQDYGRSSSVACVGGNMMRSHRLGRKVRIGLAGVAVLALGWAATPAPAATGPVSSTPAAGTPQLATTGTTEQVRQLAQCGGTMYAVGTRNLAVSYV